MKCTNTDCEEEGKEVARALTNVTRLTQSRSGGQAYTIEPTAASRSLPSPGACLSHSQSLAAFRVVVRYIIIGLITMGTVLPVEDFIIAGSFVRCLGSV